MQNIPEQDTNQPQVNVPKSMKSKPVSKIINNRYINQNIYKMFLQKRYDQCLKLISKCEQDEFKIYIKGLIAKNQFKLDKALDYFNQCQILDRNNFYYLKHIAKCLKNSFLVAKYKSSLQAVKDAMKINANDPEVHYILGKLSIALKDKKNALVHYQSSLNKQKNQAAYIEKAKLLFEENKYDQSLEVLNNAIQFSAQNPEVYELMGQIKYQKGKVDEAMKNYKEALQRDAQRFNSLLALGTLSQAMAQTNEAFEYYKKAYKISPNSAALWNNIAIHMSDKKKNIAAYSCFKRALFLDPFRWDIHANLGLLFMRHKKYLQSQIHFQSAVKIKKDSALFNLWGLSLKKLGDTKNAQACFSQGMKLEPMNEEIRFNFIMALYENKKSQEARKQFIKFNEQASDPRIKRSLYDIKHKFD